MKHNHIFKSLTAAGMSSLMGCIHYRVDCEVGLNVGNKVGGYAVQRAQTDGGN